MWACLFHCLLVFHQIKYNLDTKLIKVTQISKPNLNAKEKQTPGIPPAAMWWVYVSTFQKWDSTFLSPNPTSFSVRNRYKCSNPTARARNPSILTPNSQTRPRKLARLRTRHLHEWQVPLWQGRKKKNEELDLPYLCLRVVLIRSTTFVLLSIVLRTRGH